MENEEITKGYEYEKGKYVLIDPKEIDELKLESKQTIDLARFVDEDAIDARYFQTPYYLMPDGDMADEGYVLLQRALKETKKIGVGQFILRGHGNIVAIKPFEKGLLLEVLRHANEIRSAETLFDEIPGVKVDKEALDLAKELITRKSGKFEPQQFKDEYTEAVWELIHAKLENRAPEIVTEEPGGAKVINIMDALKKSVQQGKGGQRQVRRQEDLVARAPPRRRRARRSENRLKPWRGRKTRTSSPNTRPSGISARRPSPGRSARGRRATASSSRSTRRGAPISISGSSMTAC